MNATQPEQQPQPQFLPQARDEARKAVRDYTSRVTVLIGAGGRLTDLGSAVLLQTRGGTPFLLTAAHVVEEANWKPLSMMAPAAGGRDIRDVGVDLFLGPQRLTGGDVDVAVVTLRKDLHALLRTHAAGLESVAEDDVLGPRDIVALAGYPTYLAFGAKVDGVNAFLASIITHMTNAEGKDEKGRLKVEWKTAVPDKDAPWYPPEKNITPGQEMELADPFGVSGGGVWRVAGSSKGQIWSPSSHARLIGIAVSHRKDLRIAFAEAMPLWRDWLLEIAERIDRTST